MISQNFKSKVKDLLYTYYKIECGKIVSSSEHFYYIDAKDKQGQTLYLTLSIYGHEFNHSEPSHFQVYINGQDVVNHQLFNIDKIQGSLKKSLDVLNSVRSTYIRSLRMESRNDNYVLISGGCSMGRSYLNITYTLPYSKENGFLLFGNGNVHKIAEIESRVFECDFKIFDEVKSVASIHYLTDFSFDLYDGEQKALDDYILKIIAAYDLSLHSYKITDLDALDFLKGLNYDLITYDNIEYLKSFYTVVQMIEV